VIIRGDARHAPLAPGSVDCIVTSIPYFRLRVYGADTAREIGTGVRYRQLTLVEYLNSVVAAFRDLGEVLADDGLLWLNVGDSSIGSGGPGGDYKANGNRAGRPLYHPGTRAAFGGLDRMQVAGVPWRVALALQADGWLLRTGVTWNKGKVRRGEENEAHMRRPGTSTEMIFMLAKTTGHRWYPGRLKERGTVWTFPAKSGRRTHDAPFPDELPERCILPSTQPGDVVLDPFGGSHTTAEVAERHCRIGVSMDLYAGLTEEEAFA
jgi:DNA modification methylase